ncbi:MAG: transglycosylase SLT domain-containing protein [Gemmatimonadetes bacterium]|nr:transglycosylase SLT domain-containing protein [Gemmatimonadota bacterium]
MASVACGGARAPADPPGAVSVPEIRVEGADLGSLFEPAHLVAPEGDAVVDELLASPVLRDPEFQAAVTVWIDYWQRLAKPWFPDFLRRMGSYETTVDSALAERRLPASLRFLPLIESGYSPSASSHASAVGMWQFMAGTAGEFGMEVGPFLDERRNPYKSTEAAADFLEELHGDFGSWFLALAAYNGGPNRARRILRSYAPVAEPSDSVFWALRRHWPIETREFVPKLIAAVIVGGTPERYGYAGAERNPPLRFDVVTVPDGTTFDVLAASAEVEEREIHTLNPELFRGFTPPGRSVPVRVPQGTAETFARNYAEIPPDERMTVLEHFVAAGETLSHIAVRYGISLADLQAANPAVRPRFLRVGARLTVPIALRRRATG